MPKKYLQKNGSTSSLVGHVIIWKITSYLSTVWNNLNHAGHIPSLFSCYNQLQCVVSYFYITHSVLTKHISAQRVLSYLRLPETTKWSTTKWLHGYCIALLKWIWNIKFIIKEISFLAMKNCMSYAYSKIKLMLPLQKIYVHVLYQPVHCCQDTVHCTHCLIKLLQ